MNKNELALAMVKDSSISKTDALKVIDALLEVTTEEMKKKGGKLTLIGFGTFKSVTKKQKKGRNPRTGAEIIIPKKNVVKFVPGKQLKELVNK